MANKIPFGGLPARRRLHTGKVVPGYAQGGRFYAFEAPGYREMDYASPIEFDSDECGSEQAGGGGTCESPAGEIYSGGVSGGYSAPSPSYESPSYSSGNESSGGTDSGGSSYSCD